MIRRAWLWSAALPLIATACTEPSATPSIDGAPAMQVVGPRRLAPAAGRVAPMPLHAEPTRWPEVAAIAETFAGRAFATTDGALVFALPPREAGGPGWSLVLDLGAATTPTLRSRAAHATVRRAGVALPSGDEVAWTTSSGVDVALAPRAGNLEQIFTVPPGVAVDDVDVAVRGATLGVAPDGALVARTGIGDVTFTAPVAYQQDATGRRAAVDVRYDLRGDRFGFAVGAYDPARPLVIDPLLQSTYYGLGADEGLGGLYVTPGQDLMAMTVVTAAGYPGTAGGARAFAGGAGGDALLVRFDATLTTLEQATYVGGTSRDVGFSLSPHPSGDPVISGWTQGGWPTTAGAHNPTWDNFDDDFGIVRVAATLTSLVGGTYWNGGTAADQQEGGNCVDPATGDIYVVGEHVLGADPGMVATGHDLIKNGGTDGVILRYNATLTSLLGNTLKGLGSEANSGVAGEPGNETLNTCAIDAASHDVIVAGGASGAFVGSQATAGAYVTTPVNVDDPMVCRYSQDLVTEVACTHLGITAPVNYGRGFAPRALLVHPNGDIYLVHDVPTTVTWIPATGGAAQAAPAGGNEIVVTRFSADLSTVVASTFLGTAGDDYVFAAQVMPDGRLVLAGATTGAWPTTAGALQPDRAGAGTEGLVLLLDEDLGGVAAATYFGGPGDNDQVTGVTPHVNGSLYISGRTSDGLAGVAGGAQAAFGGGAADGFVARISANLQLTECGDGRREGAEGCDDGNTGGSDGCSAVCVVESGWACDGLTPDVCTTTCGDGLRAGDEACDDGDTSGGDGCDASCALEPGWTCIGGAPDACVATCGDGLMVGDETCDDDNTTPGDGCDASCQLEGGGTDDGDGFLEPGVGVTGGGCASGGGGGGLLLLGAIGLVGALARRRRGVLLGLLVLGGLAAPRRAQAQSAEARDFAVERLQLGVDRAAVLGLDSAWLPPARTWDASLWLGLADDPLTLYREDADGTRSRLGSLVDTRIGGELGAAFAPTDWLQVTLTAPLIVAQDRAAMIDGVSGMVEGLGGFGLGDLRLTPAVRLLDERRGVALALRLGLGLPSAGARDYRGDDGVTVTPSLALGKRLGRVRALLNLGYAVRPAARLGDLTVDDELRLGLGAAVTVTSAIDVDLTLNTATAAAAPADVFNRNYVELIGGPRVAITPRLTLFAAGGLGIDVGYGTPDARVLVGARFGAPRPTPAARPTDDLDDDGTTGGVGDGGDLADPCADTPTARGCGPDGDRDGIVDVDDGCPTAAEDRDQHEDADGCPDDDNDGDGLFDRIDDCPDAAEDVDGVADDDGCPDPDTDGDGLDDVADRCPDASGPADNGGCPDTDRDGDGVVDRLDNCPDVAGSAKRQGCKDKQLVAISGGKLELLDIVYFDRNKATIQKRSHKLLTNVATVLVAHPEVTRVTVEGHTDAEGDDAYNKDLSQRRADAVRDFLIAAGVDGVRLSAVGYGEERPIADNGSKAGRAKNRRVAFTLEGVATVAPSDDEAP